MAEPEGEVEKLPKWAQAHIRDLRREREDALRSLNEYVDGQTESPFFYEDMLCTGERGKGPVTKRVYVQTHRITVVHADVHLDVILRDEIDLQWGGQDHRSGDVAFIPSSYQAARLVSKGAMRG